MAHMVGPFYECGPPEQKGWVPLFYDVIEHYMNTIICCDWWTLYGVVEPQSWCDWWFPSVLCITMCLVHWKRSEATVQNSFVTCSTEYCVVENVKAVKTTRSSFLLITVNASSTTLCSLLDWIELWRTKNSCLWT